MTIVCNVKITFVDIRKLPLFKENLAVFILNKSLCSLIYKMSPDLSITKCRTCLSQDTKYQLTDRIEVEYIILEMLDALVPQIHIKDERSQLSQVCEICVDKLLIGYKFQQLCITTHSQLQGLKYGLFPTETDLKLRQCWDPLMEDEQVSVLKIECDVNTDNEKIDSKSVNDFEIDDSDAEAEAVEVNNSEDSDTDSR